jgi:hypothetical protein
MARRALGCSNRGTAETDLWSSAVVPDISTMVMPDSAELT